MSLANDFEQNLRTPPSTSANPYGTFLDPFAMDDNVRAPDSNTAELQPNYSVLDVGDVGPMTYGRLVRRLSIVPVLSVLEFGVVLSMIQRSVLSVEVTADLLVFLLGVAFWSFAHQLGVPLFRLFSYVYDFQRRPSHLADLGEISSALSHVAAKEIARLMVAVFLVKLGTDSLHDVLWAALGWAAGEVASGISQNYLDLAQYREVLPRSEAMHAFKPLWQRGEGEAVHVETTPLMNTGVVLDDEDLDEEDDEETIVEKELISLASLKARMELEGIYGVPVPDIPPIIFAVQWLDALLLSLGLTLILSHSFIMHQTVATSLYVLAATWVVHSCLGLLYAFAMPKIGVHAVNYFGLLVSMGSLLVGLGLWGILV